VETQSLIHGGPIRFMEAQATLLRDMAETRPTFFFGAPRVWEQFQQGIVQRLGGHEAFEQAYAANPAAVSAVVQTTLGLQDAEYLLTAAAPTPASLIHWYERLGIVLMEGFGQTEAMALIANEQGARRVGSIGRALPEVEVRISASGELQCRADGISPGYYRMPEQTAATFVDGWVCTGDRARVDADGYYYITGRVKEYFKTIQGKFVSPVPIENEFATSPLVAQQCLLGRGYAKTVMLCVLADDAQSMSREMLEAELCAHAETVNAGVEKHARIGALIIGSEPWTIENAILTPTLKLRREQLETRYGERAQTLAQRGAEAKRVLVEWG
jgi:long-chain acyl-CoA synthetase